MKWVRYIWQHEDTLQPLNTTAATTTSTDFCNVSYSKELPVDFSGGSLSLAQSLVVPDSTFQHKNIDDEVI